MPEIYSPLLKEWNSLWREQDELYHAIAAALSLSNSAFLVLYGLCEFGPGCRQRDICAAYSMSKQTVHSALQSLTAQGLLRREKGSGRDAPLFLTPEGTRFVETSIVPVVRAEDAAFAAMTPQEGAALIRLTRTYVQKLREQTQKLLAPDQTPTNPNPGGTDQ